MNRIVRDPYPVSELPENLREGLEASEFVRVVLQPLAPKPPKKPVDLQDLFDRARPSFHSLEEVADHVRAIREEWD